MVVVAHVGDSVSGLDVDYSGSCASIGEAEVRRLLSTSSIAQLTLSTTGTVNTQTILRQLHSGIVSGSIGNGLSAAGLNVVVNTVATFALPSFQAQMGSVFTIYDTSLSTLYLGSGQPPSVAEVIANLDLTAPEGFLVVACNRSTVDGSGATSYNVGIEFVARGITVGSSLVETPALQGGRIILAISSLVVPGYGGQFVLIAMPEITARHSGEMVNLPGLLAPTGARPYDNKRDFTDQGLSVRYNKDLASLKSCKDRQGANVVATSELPGRTEYAFGLAVTFVTPLKPSDPTNHEYRSTCRDTNYKLDVNSRMSALTGFTSNPNGGSGGGSGPQEDQVYLASAGYVPCDTPGGRNDTCSSQIGPEHDCGPSGSNFATNVHRRLQYTIYLDLADKERTLSTGVTQTVRYSVSALEAIDIAAAAITGGCGGNCFDTLPTSVRVEEHHDGFSRSMVQFTTGCMSLVPDQSVAAIDNVFSTCAKCPDDSTNFDFSVRLRECTGSGGDTRCSLRSATRSMTVAMNHVEEPLTIEWAIENQQKVGFYVDYRHEREYDADGLDVDGISQNLSIGPDQTDYYYETEEDINRWRNRSTLALDPVTGAFHVASSDILAISLGFQEGAAAEAVMVGALRDVHMGRFKAHCHHPAFSGSVLLESVGGVECTRRNMLGISSGPLAIPTHSPFAWIASGAPECSTYPGACQFVSDLDIVDIPQLTLSSETWGKFLIQVYDRYVDGSPQGATGGLGALFEGDQLDDFGVVTTNPILESQHLIKDGIVTAEAEATYGSCEPHRVSGPDILAGGEPMKLFFPTHDGGGRHGVCTCKGMMAYNFEVVSPVSGTISYPNRDTRQIAYAPKLYDADPGDPANLHKCPQLNYHQSADGKSLPSWDQFYITAAALDVAEEYFFHLELELIDPTISGISAQTASRRMQSTSSSSLFALGLGTSETRAITERTVPDVYNSAGMGSVIITGSSIRSTRTASETWTQLVYFTFFCFSSFLWFYPNLYIRMFGKDFYDSLKFVLIRIAILITVCVSMAIAASDVLWWFQLAAILLCALWVLISYWNAPVMGEGYCTTFTKFVILFHVIIAIVGCNFIGNEEMETSDANLSSIYSAFILFLVYIGFFVARQVVRQVVRHYREELPACKLPEPEELADGIGFYGLIRSRCKRNDKSTKDNADNVNADNVNTERMSLTNNFQCPVPEPMGVQQGDTVFRTYGIIRRSCQFEL